MANLIKGDIVKESVSYFKEYAYDTIQDRAIPSVVDGMKPSGRKILYTMYDLNLHHKAQRRKVNTVAGSVLRFSVHGDASVAGAITNMGAWFKTNIPYVDGLGNFGNIDATEPASSRYCCTGDTMVEVKGRGFMSHIEIAELSKCICDENGYIDLSEFNLMVRGDMGRWVPVHKMVDSGVHSIFKIELDNGVNLKCTRNHPVLVNDDGILKWILTENLTIGDLVVTWDETDYNVSEGIKNGHYENMFDMVRDLYGKKCYKFVPVKSVEELPYKDRVYSLVIDTKEHAYVTNGIISHNTEARLSEYSDVVMLSDMGKATVEWTKSYDDTLDEPILLPVMLPNLLINGCPSGIAVGYACNHVPHNPLDVIDLVEAYVNDRNISIDKMISIIKGPDFPTGGVINGLEGVHRAYKTGKGSVLVRGRYKTFDDNGYTTIRIYEVPFTSNTNTIYNQIAQLANAGKIKIKPRGLHDHTDMEGTKLDITLKKDEDIDRVINTLYKETDFELRVPMMNYVVTRNRKLHLATLDYMISEFVSYREEVIWKRLKNELDEKNKRIHLLDGLVIINKDMDKAIKMIRGSKGKADAKDKLMKSFKLDDIQAEYILNMAVYRLSSIEIQSVINEQKDLMKRCRDLMAWTKTKSNKNIDKIMLDEWEGLRNGLFKGYKRKTKINAKYEHISTMETIREDPMTVIITKEGYIKKFAGHIVGFETSPTTLGITNDDEIYHLIRTFENKTLVIMTDRGKVFNIAVHTIDITNKRGKLLRNIVLAKDYENVLEIWQGYDDDRTVLTISESGMMKATKPELLRGISSQGKLVHQIGRNEKLAGICHVDPKGNIVIMTAKGQILRTNGNITCTGLGGVGVVGIKLRDEDKVVGIVSTDKVIMMCTNDGYYKAIAVSDITLQNRGGLGLIGHNCKGDQRVISIKDDSVHRWVTNIGINQSYREILLGKTASRTSKGTKLPYGNITKLTEWR